MKMIFAAAFALLAQTALAHGPGQDPRYRVEEVRPPASFSQGCLDGYRVFSQGVSVNDFGIVAGNFNCYTQVDGPAGVVKTNGGPFLWSPWFGGVELQDGDPTNAAFATSFNNRGEAFGGIFPPNSILHGVRWPLGGGMETLFSDASCQAFGLDLNIAVAGNGRYNVGFGWRLAPELGSPYDFLCLQSFWLIKTPSGAEVRGPMGEARDINALNVAVGTLASQTSQVSSAIRYNLVNGQQRILNTGDASHRPLPTDINDLGEVSGYISVVPAPDDPNTCASGIAVRWDRNDRETRLPLLAGDVASRAWAMGYDGDTYGESGPGEYCEPRYSENETAVVWRNGRVFDLNASISPSARITLVSATAVNRWGQVVGYGYRNDDPLLICPRFQIDPVTGIPTYDLSERCRRGRIFLLTPNR